MSTDTETILLGVLQSYEGVLETLDRLAAVTRRLLDAHASGATIHNDVLTSYATQIASISEDRERLQQLLATWWQMIGHDRPN